jgi:uncharacterized protein YndB with AHSA1/START domain
MYYAIRRLHMTEASIETSPIVVEHDLAVTADEVWKTITEKDRMTQWFFESIDSFEPVVGFETQFDVKSADNEYRHQWRVTEVAPGIRMVVNWRYEGYGGDSFVTFELFPENQHTRLRLTHSGQDTFPRDNPDFSRESCTEAWNLFIGKRLKAYLEGAR